MAGRRTRAEPGAQRFGPQRISLAPLLIALLGALPIAASSPWLLWLLLLPIAGAWWVLTAKVVADRDGLTVGNGGLLRTYRWPDIDGVDVPKRGPVRLVLTGGRRVVLTALPRRDVRRMLALAPRGQRTGG